MTREWKVLALEPRIEWIGLATDDCEAGRLWMERVEQEVAGLGNDGTGNRKERGRVTFQPLSAQVAGDVQTVLPMLRKLSVVDPRYLQIVRDGNFEQGIAGRDVVGAGMDADFEERSGGSVGEIDDRVADVVPSPRQPKTAGSA